MSLPRIVYHHSRCTISEVQRLLTVALLTVAVAGCGGDGATYSTEEVVEAFRQQGYMLTVPTTLPEGFDAGEGDLLTPKGWQPFMVIVGTNEEAGEAWPSFESQQTEESFDARRANVIVISDAAVRAVGRPKGHPLGGRVTRALAQPTLPSAAGEAAER